MVIISELGLASGIMSLHGLAAIPGMHYYYLAVIQIGTVALYILLVPWIPETPSWLMLKFKDKNRVIAVLKYLRGPQNDKRISEEYAGIEFASSGKKLSAFKQLRVILCDVNVLIPFLLIIFLFLLQEFSGAISIIDSYAAEIYYNAGAPNPNLMAMLSIGISTVVAFLVLAVLVEKLGRKSLLILSVIGMVIGTALLGFHGHFTRPSQCPISNTTSSGNTQDISDGKTYCNQYLYPISVVGLILTNFSFCVGLCPVPLILLSEYLPLNVRGIAGGIATATIWLSGILVSGLYFSYVELVGDAFVWWTFTVIALIALVIIIACIKETKGKSLEEIETLFNYKCTRNT